MYQLMFTLADGHRVFATDAQPGFLIADDSGETPDQTDDGELFLELRRNLSIEQVERDGRIETRCSIPLRTAEGEMTSTPSNPVSILNLAHTFRWAINVGDGKGRWRTVHAI